MTGLLQYGVWTGGVDLLLVKLNLIELMIKAIVASEVDFRFLKLCCSNLQIMF
jgi:hypothetical protein